MTKARIVVKTEESKWDLVPLPPNTYEKSVSWSRGVVVVKCAWPDCKNETAEERVLCDTHFYGFLQAVKYAAARDEKLRMRMENR